MNYGIASSAFTAGILLAGVGVALFFFARRHSAGLLMLIVGTSTSTIAGAWPELRDPLLEASRNWWQSLSLFDQLLYGAMALGLVITVFILTALALLRLIAIPFIGRHAANGLVAGLGAYAFRGLFVGVFGSTFRWFTRLLRRH